MLKTKFHMDNECPDTLKLTLLNKQIILYMITCIKKPVISDGLNYGVPQGLEPQGDILKYLWS
jgi:hypothetical protein